MIVKKISGLCYMMNIYSMKDQNEIPFHRDKNLLYQNKKLMACLFIVTRALVFLLSHISA